MIRTVIVREKFRAIWSIFETYKVSAPKVGSGKWLCFVLCVCVLICQWWLWGCCCWPGCLKSCRSKGHPTDSSYLTWPVAVSVMRVYIRVHSMPLEHARTASLKYPLYRCCSVTSFSPYTFVARCSTAFCETQQVLYESDFQKKHSAVVSLN